jgi:protein-disulfide isomerase
LPKDNNLFLYLQYYLKNAILNFRDSAIYSNIRNTMQILKEKGFYGTPTVVINGRIIMDSYSSEEIEKVVNEELNKYQ